MQQRHIRQVVVLLACLAAILILASGTAGVANAGNDRVPQVLPHDDFDSALALPDSSWTWVDIASTTEASDDPTFTCTGSKHYKTVWFKYTPSTLGRLHADTYGSEYDTVLAIWRGTRGNLTKVGCSNNSGGTTQSEVNALVMGNTTYYIEVAALWPNPIDTYLGLHVTFTQKYNLLVNPGFELDANSDTQPDNWLTSPVFVRLFAPGVTAGGSYAGEFEAADNANYYTNQAVSVTAGHSYRFLGYVAISQSDSFTFKILARWRDASNTLIGTDTIYTTTTETPGNLWEEVNKNLLAPAGATSVLIVPNIQSLNGWVCIDKFFFVDW